MIDWNDMKFVLALSRQGTLSDAAKLLKVDQTTVSRRIKTLEQQLGAAIFYRKQNRLIPSQAGERLVASAEEIESSVLSTIDEIDKVDSKCEGKVRLTSVALLMNKIISKNIGLLLQQHPGLEVELIGSSDNLSFSKRQTDLALRLDRPVTGSADCVKISELSYSAYHLKTQNPDKLPWIGYAGEHQSFPQAVWLKKYQATKQQLCVDNDQIALDALKGGYGRCLLPDYVMKNEPALVADPLFNKALIRELWLLIHPEMRHLKRIKVFAAFLKRLFIDLDLKRG